MMRLPNEQPELRHYQSESISEFPFNFIPFKIDVGPYAGIPVKETHLTFLDFAKEDTTCLRHKII